MRLFDRADNQRWDVSRVQELSWRELELMVGAALQSKGYDVEVTPPVNDGGRDVDAGKIDLLRSILFRPKIVPHRKRLIIDAKQWSEPVHSGPIEDIADTADEKGGKGVIASPSGFRESAETEAVNQGVKLYDGTDIANMFNETDIEISEVK